MSSPGLGAVAGLAIDQAVGEPPARWHPVARYGALMERIERRTYADSRPAGALHLAVGVGAALTAGLALRRAVGPALAAAVATWACAAGRMLDDEALAVAALLDAGDLDGARTRLRSLVGRDTGGLDASGVSRAVIESVAENGVDAVTAPVLWAAVAGGPGVLAHRAVNTLDAMVGHRDDWYRRFGRASARLDDLLNYLPARLTAIAVATSRPRSAAAIGAAVHRDAPAHPSPNGGVVEAAFAAALGVQLGGVNRYGDQVEDRGTLGDGRPAEAGDIVRAVRLRRESTAVVALAVLAASLVRSPRRGRVRRAHRSARGRAA